MYSIKTDDLNNRALFPCFYKHYRSLSKHQGGSKIPELFKPETQVEGLHNFQEVSENPPPDPQGFRRGYVHTDKALF